MKKNLESAFSEVIDILNYIEIEFKNKIPNDMLQMFESECNKTYLKELIQDKTDISQKKYSEEALAIIAYLNLKYWCENSEEKKKYRDMYLKNNDKII